MKEYFPGKDQDRKRKAGLPWEGERVLVAVMWVLNPICCKYEQQNAFFGVWSCSHFKWVVGENNIVYTIIIYY